MAFAQLTYRNSIRNMKAHTFICSGPETFMASGFHGRCGACRCWPMQDNESRNRRNSADFAQVLIRKTSPYYASDPINIFHMIGGCYALDSTITDLSLSLFPSARFRGTKAAVKMPPRCL